MPVRPRSVSFGSSVISSGNWIGSSTDRVTPYEGADGGSTPPRFAITRPRGGGSTPACSGPRSLIWGIGPAVRTLGFHPGERWFESVMPCSGRVAERRGCGLQSCQRGFDSYHGLLGGRFDGASPSFAAWASEYAAVAQVVEQRSPKPHVGSSSLPRRAGPPADPKRRQRGTRRSSAGRAPGS